jgi:hypothetical protein
MLSEEWLRAIQADRKREIEAAQRARAARGVAPRPGRLRTWLRDHLTERPTPVRGGAQTGPAATDLSA